MYIDIGPTYIHVQHTYAHTCTHLPADILYLVRGAILFDIFDILSEYANYNEVHIVQGLSASILHTIAIKALLGISAGASFFSV